MSSPADYPFTRVTGAEQPTNRPEEQCGAEQYTE